MTTEKKSVSFKEFLFVWIKVAINSFGGPAGQISVMHKLIVEEKKWINESRFLHALNYCMLLPGPEAQQLATYIGWLLYRFKGGLLAGILFVLPGFTAILILSILYALYQETKLIEALFFGLKAAVLAVVVEAVFKIGKKVLKNTVMYIIAGAAFIAIFFLDIPFPLIILTAGITGFIGGKLREDKFFVIKPKEAEDEKQNTRYILTQTKPSLTYAVKIFFLFGLLWLLPVIILAVISGSENIFVQQGVFFSKAAVVTFGGAYAVLAYISQEAVQTYGWLEPGEMLDGLGMAETTPGPLIQVVQFVGFLGAYRLYSELDPIEAGVLASIIVTWVTFMPSFLWIFLGAPFIENLREVKWLNTALSAITAAVVGVILNLALWFFIHTVFEKVNVLNISFIRLYVPEFSSINIFTLLIALGSFIAMFKFKTSMMKTLGGAVIVGFLSYFL